MPKDIDALNDAFWDYNDKFENAMGTMFSAMVAISSNGRGPQLAERTIKMHSQRTDQSFAMFYIDATQTMLTSWTMMVVPIMIYGFGAMLVEINFAYPATLIAILSSFGLARGNLMALCSMKEEYKLSMDLVSDLAGLLNSANDRILRKAAHTERVMKLLKETGPGSLNVAHTMSLHLVDYASPDTDTMIGASGLQDCSGSIPLGYIFGFEQKSGSAEEMRQNVKMEMLMAIFAGLRTPSDGVMLMPPHVDVRVVCRDPGLITDSTVYENLTFGLTLEMQEELKEDQVFIDKLAALCLKFEMNPNLFGKRAIHLPMMQVLTFATSQERGMVALIRSLLPLVMQYGHDVLLIQDVSMLDEVHAKAVHLVLTRFVVGHDLDGIIADVPTTETAHLTPRTVVWSMPEAAIKACGVRHMCHLSEDNQLTVTENGRPMSVPKFGEFVSPSDVQLTETKLTPRAAARPLSEFASVNEYVFKTGPPLGLKLMDVGSEIVVNNLEEGGQASKAGVPLNGVLLAINGKSMSGLTSGQAVELVGAVVPPIKLRVGVPRSVAGSAAAWLSSAVEEAEEDGPADPVTVGVASLTTRASSLANYFSSSAN